MEQSPGACRLQVGAVHELFDGEVPLSHQTQPLLIHLQQYAGVSQNREPRICLMNQCDVIQLISFCSLAG